MIVAENNSGVARVEIKIVRPGVFRATVMRDKDFGGRCVPQIEYIAESLCEKTLRRTLNRFGYPSTKRLVPVSP